MRFFKDGRDFASMGVRASQRQNRVLCALHSLSGRGDWHRSLDRPDNGIFRAKDLRVRIELEGKGARAIKSPAGGFALQAGENELAVVPGDGTFLGKTVVWEIDQQPNLVAVEAVCYLGQEQAFDFKELLDVQIAFGLQLRELGTETKAVTVPELKLGKQRIDVKWSGLHVAVPAK